MQIYTSNKAKHHDIVPGQLVLVTNQKQHRGKFQPLWQKQPAQVINGKGNTIEICHNEKRYMQNLSHIKPYRTVSTNQPLQRDLMNAGDRINLNLMLGG